MTTHKLVITATFTLLAVLLTSHRAQAECQGAETPLSERRGCREAALKAIDEAKEEIKQNAPDANLAALKNIDSDREPPASPKLGAAIAKLKVAIANAKLLAVTADEVFQTSHCADALVICFDRNGGLTTNETWPRTVVPGDKLTFVVITNIAQDQQTTTVTVVGHKSNEQLFPDSSPQSQLAQAKLLNDATDTPDNFMAFTIPSDPIAADATTIAIEFRRTDGDTTAVATTHTLDVDLGYSYFSIGLLVASTYNGDRRVLHDLDVVSTHAVEPGIALNLFPGGRQRGIIGYIRRCTVETWVRCVANNLGLQLGTSLDLTTVTDRLYAGVVFEPIAGLGFSGGISLRKVNVVPPPGGLPAIETTTGASPADRRYVLRGYVGVTLTLDLLTSIAQAGTDIRKLAAQ